MRFMWTCETHVLLRPEAMEVSSSMRSIFGYVLSRPPAQSQRVRIISQPCRGGYRCTCHVQHHHVTCSDRPSFYGFLEIQISILYLTCSILDQPMLTLNSCSSVQVGVVMGDAAHALKLSSGQEVSMTLEDASSQFIRRIDNVVAWSC